METSVKFICTADLHVKVNKDAPESWSTNRYRLLFKEIIKACLDNNAYLLLAGDVLHKNNPSLDELKLIFEFFKMIADNKIKTILISGNHEDIAEGINVYDFLSIEVYEYIYYSSNPCPIKFTNITVYPLDHDKIHLGLHKGNLEGKFKILLSHFRCDLGDFIKEEINVRELIEPFSIAICGDIHSEINLYDKLYYCNHPLNSSYEPKPDCSYLLLTVSGTSYDIQRIPTDLPNLVSVTCSVTEFSSIKLEPKNFHKITVNGTREELRTIPASLPNAKIVKVPEDQLVYDSDIIEEEAEEITESTSEDEFVAYMQKLGYGEPLISKLMTQLREIGG